MANKPKKRHEIEFSAYQRGESMILQIQFPARYFTPTVRWVIGIIMAFLIKLISERWEDIQTILQLFK